MKLRPKTVIVIAALGLAALSGCSTSEPASEAISGKRAIAAPRAGTPTSRPATDLTTHTGQDVPCEPINVALVGTRKEITRAFQTIGWRQPHSINPLSSLAMAFSVVLYLPYGQAPMTRLYFDGRQQDMSFERIEGSPARRHHIRLWMSDQRNVDGRPIWFAAASFDSGLRFNFLPGPIMHKLSPDLDRERDDLLATLNKSGCLEATRSLKDAAAPRTGRNALGDRYYTDGKVMLAVLTASKNVRPSPQNTSSKKRPAVQAKRVS